MVKIENITFEEKSRIIVISDIHGQIDILKKLLKKVSYTPQRDYLMLLGDFAQKGKYPLETLRYIIELSKIDKVYALLGNCDHGNFKLFRKEYLNTDFKELLNYPHTLLYDMYQEYKQANPKFEQTDLDSLQDDMKEYFINELTFLENLPYIIESKDLIFVHAGLDKIEDYHNSFYRSVFMKRYFLNEGHLAHKMVICGHFPVTIYRQDEFNDNIIIDYKKHIISIDGGLVVKDGGQLNALIINKNKEDYQYETAFEDGLPQVLTKKESIENQRGKGACWPNFNLRLLEKGEYFSKIILTDTNEITFIKNEYLCENNTKAYDDCPASILGVPKGVMVGIINDKCKGYVLIKYQGKQGWVKKEVIEGEENEKIY